MCIFYIFNEKQKIKLHLESVLAVAVYIALYSSYKKRRKEMFLSKNTLTFTDIWHRACDKGPSPNLNKVYFICTIRQTGEHIPQYLLYQHRLIQMKE